MNQLEIRNLHLVAGDKNLLTDFSVRMRSGECWVVLGANGSGKTTLLHTLAGLKTPESGTVLLNNKSLHLIPHRQRAQAISIMFQDYEAIFPGTVLETVLVSRYPYSGWSQLFGDSDEDRNIAQSALRRLELDNFANRSMASLSGGERRRVQMAALLAQTTPIQLLDEPTNHLDLHQQTRLLNCLGGSNEKLLTQPGEKTLTVIVMHDINQAIRHGTHAIMLYPDGSGVAGSIGDIVDKNSLEKLYGCSLQEISHSGQSYFFPC